MHIRSLSHALMRQWKNEQASTSTEKQRSENADLISQYKQMNDFFESCFKQVVLPEHTGIEGVRGNLHM